MDTHSWIICIPFFCFVATIFVGVTGVIIYFIRKNSSRKKSEFVVSYRNASDTDTQPIPKNIWDYKPEKEKPATKIPVFELEAKTDKVEETELELEMKEDPSTSEKIENKIPTEKGFDWTIFENELKEWNPVIDTLEPESEEASTEPESAATKYNKPLTQNPTKKDWESNFKKTVGLTVGLLEKHFPIINRVRKFKLKLI